MNEQHTWVELAQLPIAKMQDVLLARFVARDEASKIGFSQAMLTRVATAVSEITRNVVQHAGSAGEVRFYSCLNQTQSGLRITVIDKGRGIEQPERFLQEGHVGVNGAGLPGTLRLVDLFEIKSVVGSGTTVTMEIWTQHSRAPEASEK